MLNPRKEHNADQIENNRFKIKLNIFYKEIL